MIFNRLIGYALLASCSELNLNLEVVARTVRMVHGAVIALKLIALAERLNERQRNLLRLWPCHRLRTVWGSAKDGLEEALARPKRPRPRRPNRASRSGGGSR